VDRLRSLGWFAVRIVASPMQRAGLPDILVQLKHPPGRAFWVEMKMPGGKPSKLQLAVMDELRAGGAVCVVTYTVEDTIAAALEAESAWRRQG
jgi:hypothetical protein